MVKQIIVQGDYIVQAGDTDIKDSVIQRSKIGGRRNEEKEEEEKETAKKPEKKEKKEET